MNPSALQTPHELTQLFVRAVMLWISRKVTNPTANPSEAIVAVLTRKQWPPALPLASDVMELCDVINQLMGGRPLDSEERDALQLWAIDHFEMVEARRVRLARWRQLRWLNWIALALSISALVTAGVSWLLIGVTLAVFVTYFLAYFNARVTMWGPHPMQIFLALATVHGVLLALSLILGIQRLAG